MPAALCARSTVKDSATQASHAECIFPPDSPGRHALARHPPIREKSMKRMLFAAAAIGAAVATSAADFGQKVEALAKSQAFTLFGVAGTLGGSSTLQRSAAELEANPA